MWVCPSARVRVRPSDLAGVSRPPDRLRMSAAACVGIVQMRSRSEIRHCRGMKATEPTRHFLLWPGGRGLPRTREGGNECKTPSLLFSSCEDCVGRRSRRGSLWLACCHKLICPLERQREGGFNCFAIRASELSLFRGEDHIANFERGNANMFTTTSTWWKECGPKRYRKSLFNSILRFMLADSNVSKEAK